MRLFHIIAGGIACLSLAACGNAERQNDASAYAPPSDREILFEDNFDAASLDREAWNVMGPEFWVNDELQAYVDSPETIAFAPAGSPEIEGADGGALILKPVFSEGFETPTGRKADFLSGRVNTRDKFDFTHGRAEARIKMPDAVGVWPAFWLLGNGQWPQTGEIDIMEYVGRKDWTAVALHGDGYSGETPIVERRYFPGGTDATDWHHYAVEWTTDEITFEVDGDAFYTVPRAEVEQYGPWRFDTPKFIILNFAVGGIYPYKVDKIEEPYYGLPAETAERIKAGELAMYVDWVRVYAPQRITN